MVSSVPARSIDPPYSWELKPTGKSKRGSRMFLHYHKLAIPSTPTCPSRGTVILAQNNSDSARTSTESRCPALHGAWSCQVLARDGTQPHSPHWELWAPALSDWDMRKGLKDRTGGTVIRGSWNSASQRKGLHFSTFQDPFY